jgi:hypothetical protein
MGKADKTATSATPGCKDSTLSMSAGNVVDPAGDEEITLRIKIRRRP